MSFIQFCSLHEYLRMADTRCKHSSRHVSAGQQIHLPDEYAHQCRQNTSVYEIMTFSQRWYIVMKCMQNTVEKLKHDNPS